MAGRSRLWRGNYGGRFELLPGQALAAAVAVGLKFPLYAAPALGTDGKKSPAEVADDIGKVSGTAVAPLRRLLVAEVFRVTEPEKGGRQIF